MPETNEAAPAVFKIAEVARLAGVSASTLRLWESQGLIVPERAPSGHRRYRDAEVRRAKRISWYRTERGLNPAAIRAALQAEAAGEDTPPQRQPAVTEIGRKLRALRRASGQTLEQVAEAVGLTPSVLSTLERTSQGVGFRMLHELARHYGTTVSKLSGDAVGDRSLVRSGEWQSWPQTTPGVTVQILAEGDCSMDCHRFVLAPGASSDGAYSHDGEEFLHVLSGGIEIMLEGEEFHVLGPGDSLYFSSRRPHAWLNSHDGETVLIWINTPRSF
ncbi:MAG: MerR family transcriptional regulator [Rhodobacteraceae bacterium]|nr:MerR family transcriptional regulator [Paracoccaceae bacterium]